MAKYSVINLKKEYSGEGIDRELIRKDWIDSEGNKCSKYIAEVLDTDECEKLVKLLNDLEGMATPERKEKITHYSYGRKPTIEEIEDIITNWKGGSKPSLKELKQIKHEWKGGVEKVKISISEDKISPYSVRKSTDTRIYLTPEELEEISGRKDKVEKINEDKDDIKILCFTVTLGIGIRKTFITSLKNLIWQFPDVKLDLQENKGFLESTYKIIISGEKKYMEPIRDTLNAWIKDITEED